MSVVSLHLVPSPLGWNPQHPIIVHVDTPPSQLESQYSGPDFTLTGVVCGACSDDLEREARHASADRVRFCHQRRVEWEDEAAAEAPLIAAGIL